MLHQWERKTWKFGFVTQLDKGRITTMKDLGKLMIQELALFCDEGLVLEMSDFQILHSGNLIFINSFNTKI